MSKRPAYSALVIKLVNNLNNLNLDHNNQLSTLTRTDLSSILYQELSDYQLFVEDLGVYDILDDQQKH